MINILILSCGTNASYHFIKTIKEKFTDDFRIIGADINEQYLISSGFMLDKFYKVPYSDSPEYNSVILKICEDEKINVILPSFDNDQKLFNDSNDNLKKLGIISLGTPIETFDIYPDKSKMNSFLENNGFVLPKTYNNIPKTEEKFIVKPKNGTGSTGVRVLSGNEINELKDRQNLIVQELCTKPEVTLECFYYNGRISTVARERIEAKSGVCTKAKIYYNKELENIAVKFAEKIKTPYYFNLQFMKNSEDKFVITDVNLKLAGGMGLSYSAGWDEVSGVAKILLGKSDEDIFTTMPKINGTKWAVRAYTDIITKEEKPVVAFDLDGTLLDSRERHKIVLDDVLKQFGLSLNTSDLIDFKSDGKNNKEYLIYKGVPEAEAEKIQNEWIKNIEKECYLNLDKLYNNTLDLLKNSLKDYKIILVTARNNKEGLYNQLEKLKIKDCFSEIFVVKADKNVTESKAEILRKENAVKYTGDTKSDYMAAKTANIDFEYHEHGFHKKQYVLGE